MKLQIVKKGTTKVKMPVCPWFVDEPPAAPGK